MKRVVVTGLGIVSPIGSTIEEIARAFKEKKCAVDEITAFDARDYKATLACECKNFDPKSHFSPKEIKRLDRVNQFGIVAARNALKDSNIDLDIVEALQIGAFIASGIGGLNTIEKEAEKANIMGYQKISPFFIPMAIANMTAAHVAIDLGIHGPVNCPVNACAASAQAILDAFMQIKNGDLKIAFAGGSEASINRLAISGFSSMKALSFAKEKNRASIPFDIERDGFIMGEGAAVLVLEEYEHAKKRGAKIYAEILSGASTCDANHITAPAEGGKWAAKSMELAIKKANLKPANIDYINAHGTSTPLNDEIETEAIKRVFEDDYKRVLVSSTKSMTGHLLGASGALEASLTIISMFKNILAPNVNYEKADPKCDLNIIKDPLDHKIKYALSNSFGFGGHNVCISIKNGEN